MMMLLSLQCDQSFGSVESVCVFASIDLELSDSRAVNGCLLSRPTVAPKLKSF